MSDLILPWLIALAVRWKFLEAFVVPTGAMAPTIYGAHADVVCANCGMEYAVSMSQWAERPWGREPVSAACPNCGQPGEVGLRDPILRGDRIAVEKLSRPRRWDLMVFKYPEDRKVTFVKRVVGLPGETLEIFDGDLFINGRRLHKTPTEARDMWFFVHDSSRAVKRPVPDGPCWQPTRAESAWKLAGGKWTFSGTNAVRDELVFRGRLSDELSYNEKSPGVGQASSLAQGQAGTLVLQGDIKLDCDVEQFSGEGHIEFSWEFRGRKVAAKISPEGVPAMMVSRSSALTPGPSPKGRGEFSGGPSPKGRGEDAREDSTHGGRPVAVKKHLCFAVRDGRAYLLQDGRIAVSAAIEPDELARVKAEWSEPKEPCRLAIVASRCRITLARMVLWKDAYYRNLDQIAGVPAEPAYGCTGHPIRLGKGEYFVLGDNSGRSKDARFWGPVPAADVTGIARWTYWPPSRCHRFQ